MRPRALCLALVLLLSPSCNQDRITSLEKRTADLEEQLKKVRQSSAFEMTERCSKAAKAYFDSEWRPSADANTILLTQINHFNTQLGKCLIVIDFNYREGGKSSDWYRDSTVYDVFENSTQADVAISHTYDAHFNDSPRVLRCYAFGKPCKSMEEFSTLLRPYLTE